ncbi:hypothetical protein QL285_032644 [Trifolium repens]|nr:hypothetical protein QL285_032644 [Trifolium repens]
MTLSRDSKHNERQSYKLVYNCILGRPTFPSLGAFPFTTHYSLEDEVPRPKEHGGYGKHKLEGCTTLSSRLPNSFALCLRARRKVSRDNDSHKTDCTHNQRRF